jgi:hypothetical protein
MQAALNVKFLGLNDKNIGTTRENATAKFYKDNQFGPRSINIPSNES